MPRLRRSPAARASAAAPARLEVDIVKLLPGGVGLAHDGGRTFLVPGVCPGERVVIDPRAQRPRLLEVVRASPDRVDPECRHHARCGGCDLMHVAASRQASMHADIVRELLSHGADGDAPDIAVHAAPRALGYRTRARLAFRAAGRQAVVGFRTERSHDIVAFEKCIVLDPRLEAALAAVRALLSGATSSGEISIGLGQGGAGVVEIRAREDLPPATFGELHRLVEARVLAGARVFLGDAAAPLVFGDPRGVTRGADDEPLLVGAGGFAQASEEGAIQLARRVAALAEPSGKRVVELFAGSGTLSVLLAKDARSFVGVEIDKEASASAKANLDARGIAAKLVAADVETFAIPSCDVVILDPPRAGAKGAVQAILKARPRRVVYVACDPATLARDVGVLRGGGYAVTAIETLELFPQTSHVETLVAMEPRRHAGKGA